MGSSGQDNQAEHSGLIAGRYRVQEPLGKGGMAVIYRVHDASTGRDLALKQLSLKSDADRQRRVVELFEREFHTLLHLSHPRVVQVYDYGKDDAGAYYTMELLDGGDLSELSPLPWAEACALLCDVCSALSLLHSRRLVHRDLTPRNIRCTQDQKAKLIDFGAMMPMGLAKHLVGTPAFVAPEAVNGQALDARTDLFSLGATAYYALTHRHAYYGGRGFAGLRDAWRSQPAPPSRYVPEIPKELDELVMLLIHLDFMARPTSAAEVMERLSAIAGLQIDEQLVVRQAYLSTPTLVGRDEPLLHVRKQMVRALRYRGGAIMVTGASGVGRSRFLDASVLEAKLAGSAVLRADAADASQGSWGAVQAMARQLLDEVPQAALRAARPHAPVLGHILPELLGLLQPAARADPMATSSESGSVDFGDSAEACGGRPTLPARARAPRSIALKVFDNPQELRPRVQEALCEWLLEVSRQRCLVLAVDDVHRIDEPSAAFVALLSHRTANRRVVVVVTAETDAPATSQKALALLSEAGARIKLRNLGPEDTDKLLGSIFGEVPNVRLVADRIHGISGGNPRAIMQLAQHLLDNRLVRYEAGAWTLPSSIDAGDLPQTLTEALRVRVQSLSPTAKALAQTMALCSKQSFSFEECLFLATASDKAALLNDLDQLVAQDVLGTDGEYYALSQASWRRALTEELAQEQARALHLRLAEMLQRRSTETTAAVQHLLKANEPERALDVYLRHIAEIRERHLQDSRSVLEHIQSLPKDWNIVPESLLTVCKELGRPRKQAHMLQEHLITVAAVTAQAKQDHLVAVLDRLYRDCGLDIYEELGDSVDASARLPRALELAQQRFDATAESERTMSPAEAIPNLARVIVQAIGGVGGTHDFAFFEAMPSLGPLVSLSPALEVVEKNLQSTTHNTAGRAHQARQGWLEILDRMAQPDRAGLDETHQTYMGLAIMYAVATIESFIGQQSATQWIDKIEKDPLFEVNAWRLRMVLALRQGDCQKAEEHRRRVELLQIQNSPTQFFEGSVLWGELLGYVAVEDLLRVKQVISGIEEMAERHPGWVACLGYARGEYHRLRGDFTSALAEFEQVLASVAPGRHSAWLCTAGAQLTTLFHLGRLAEAKALGQEAMKAAAREELGALTSHYLEQPLALICTALGEHDSAVAHATSAIDALQELGAGGVMLGSAYETRARVAIMMKDDDSFQTYAQLCADQYHAGNSPSLTAKYEKLLQEARRTKIGMAANLAQVSDVVGQTEHASSALATVLGACRGPVQRAERALDLLVQHGGCLGGLLYTMQERGPALAAQSGSQRPPPDIDSLVEAYLSAELQDASEVTLTEVDMANETTTDAGWSGPEGTQFVPVMLAHDTDSGFAVTGVAVLCVAPSEKLKVPYALLPILSASLLEAGDVVTAFAAG